MSGAQAYIGAVIHDGHALHESHALVIERSGTRRIVARGDVPSECVMTDLKGGFIAPGFVDLQLNGGGGVMFNDAPTVDTLRTIAAAHRSLGTALMLPTLITDTPARTAEAIAAVQDAIAQGVEGIAGMHLEGPHLSVAKKGAHDAALIRPMTDDDLAVIVNAADCLPNLMVTVAPENTTNAQIAAMAKAGVIVSLGHTDADFDTCLAAFDSGARAVTHLFNAMSQLNSREPGLVGAALSRGDVVMGLIADGIHVHPHTIRLALALGGENVMLVTDAMATAGSDIEAFTLNGRRVLRGAGRLTLEDGTLAGADLTMSRALSVMTAQVGDSPEAAITRATGTPLSLLRGVGGGAPLLNPRLSVNHLSADFTKVTPLVV